MSADRSQITRCGSMVMNSSPSSPPQLRQVGIGFLITGWNIALPSQYVQPFHIQTNQRTSPNCTLDSNSVETRSRCRRNRLTAGLRFDSAVHSVLREGLKMKPSIPLLIVAKQKFHLGPSVCRQLLPAVSSQSHIFRRIRENA